MSSGNWKTAGRSTMLSLALVAATVTTVFATPKQGESLPAARVESLDGRVLDTRTFAGKNVLVFYEDKDAAKHNMALKNDLAKVKSSPGWKPNVLVAAVADVSAYDWWPAKGFVKDAIQAESRKAGITIYCDWSGEFGRAVKAKKGASNVILVGPDGKVQLSHEGVVPQSVRDAITSTVRKQ